MAKRHFNIKTTIEQEKEIAKAYLNGEMIINLIRRYDLGRKAIEGALRRQGIVLSKENDAQRKRILSPKQEQKAVELYQSGYSMSQVRDHFGLKSLHAVFNTMQRYDIPAHENRTYHFNEHAFDVIGDEHTHYWLGFIYADGNVNHTALRIGLSYKDELQLIKIRDFMQSKCKIRTDEIRTCVEFHSVHLAHQLATKGIIAYRGKFNLTIEHIRQEMANHFIRGYLDGDGCISVNEQVVFEGQVDILAWIRETLNRECQASKISIRKRQGIYEVSWGGIRQARRIVKYIYRDATIWMERKRKIANNWRCGDK